MVSVRGISALGMLIAFSSLLGLSSCLYDSSDRCDKGQAYDANAGLCVCTGHSTPGTTESGSQGCVCEEGYQRPTPDAECEAAPDALGRACQSDQDCNDATYDSCHVLEDGSGYCTNEGCAKDECAGGNACDTV